MKSADKGNPPAWLSASQDAAGLERLDELLRQRTHELGERIKELNCLYGISHLVEQSDLSLADIVQGTVNLIPPAWQYPEITGARIVLKGRQFSTDNFRDTPWKQSAAINSSAEAIGLVEVCYLEERPAGDEGPFLKEERTLLNAIAERLGRVIQRQRTEKALRESELRYRTLFDHSPDGILLIDPDTMAALEFNDPACRQLGYTRAEFAQLKITDYEALEHQEHTRLRIEKILHEGRDCFETKHCTKSGDLRDVLVTVQRLVLGDQPLLHCIFRDITERKRAEEAIHLNEARLNSLFNLSQEAFNLAERDIINFGLEEAVKVTRSKIGYFHFVNDDQNTIQLFTWSQETLKLCKAVSDNHYPIEQAGVWADCARFRKPVIHNDYQSLPTKKGYPEGHSHLIRHMSVPVIDQDKVRMIIGVGNKETDYDEADARQLLLVANDVWKIVCRRRAEEDLRNSEARLREAERLAQLGGWDWDLVKGTLNCSDEVYRIFGFKTRALTPSIELFFSHVHPDDRDRVRQALNKAVHDRRPYDIDYRIIRADGLECFIHAQGEIAVDASGQPVRMLGTVQDISERRQLEAQYLRAQRMESIGLLAGGLAHDLNNVLAPIMMSVDLLRASTGDPEFQEIIEIITASARRGADIIKQVLTFARGVEGEHLAVQAKHIIREVAAIIRETFPRNIQIDVQLPRHLPAIVGDPTQLHQVLMNLCVNARDAMPGGGKLTLAAGNLTIDKGLAYAQLKPGNYVVLEVIDTGTGIPAEIIERVFEPFFTTKEPGKGTGLGLSTVLGIVRSHGGLVKVRTAPGAGSDFEIYLPAVAADSQDLDQEAVAPQGKGQRILVVDDEPAVRELIGEILRRNGYQVLSAADGAEAVSMFSEPKWRIDLVIADIMMPLMDGVTLVRRLCRLSPSLRIIASTGLDYSAAGTEGTDDNRRRELQRLGVSIFLSKPYRAKTLLNAVHEALSTGTAAKPPIELMLS